MSDQARDPALTALEAALAALRPAPDALERDTLMYQAGRASVRRPGWLWPGATAMLAVALAGVLAWRPTKVEERVVIVPTTAERSDHPGYDTVSLPEPPRDGYLRLRQRVLRDGVEALTAPNGPPQQTNPAGPPAPLLRAIPLSGAPR